MRTRRVGWWLPAPLFAVVVSLLAGGVSSLWQLSRASERVRHTNEVRLSLGGFLSTVINAETGVRGYALTGDPSSYSHTRPRKRVGAKSLRTFDS